VREVQRHARRKHWKLLPSTSVPIGAQIFDSIWAMWRKRCIGTGEVRKYKDRLNAHGGQQIHGISYWDTFAPVVMWTTIRLVLKLTLIDQWKSRQLDFVLVYPQSDIEGTLFMKLPKGFELDSNENRKTHVLQLLKNIYGLKQAGRVWNKHLHRGAN